MDKARYARQSDRDLNPNFRRRWEERFVPRPASVADDGTADAEDPAFATVAAWRDEWRARRAARSPRQEAPR
jgi:hypothetical protein